jgi:hypothetical protein
MNVRLLIEAIVRQMTVLLAELATSGGLRAPLANVADRVFIELARELESHGVSRTVSADMFGLALRTYLRRIRRHDESVSDKGKSLWEAVLAYVEENGVVSRNDVLTRFAKDDDALVRGVLQDLTDSGMLFRSGVRSAAVYRVALPSEVNASRRRADDDAVDNMIWALVRREGPVTSATLLERTALRAPDLDASLTRLATDGRIERSGSDAVPEYRARSLVIPVGATAGWEAAVFDHFHAVVKTIVSRLRLDADAPHKRDRTGGSTYSFEVWDGHPMQDEVRGQLARYRETTTALRKRVDAYNDEHGSPASLERVTVYFGQCSTEEEGLD